MCKNLNVTQWETKDIAQAIRTTIPGIMGKDNSIPTILKTTSLQMIDELYPAQIWTHIYTDGSAEEAIRNGGAGVFINYPDGSSRSISLPTGKICTNFKAEMIAIQTALKQIDPQPNEHYAIFTDSMAAIQNISANKTDTTTQNTITALQCKSATSKIIIQWIPAHCGIPGNERADRLAKAGSQSVQQITSTSYKETKTLVKSAFRNKWKKEHNEYDHTKDAMHTLDRNEQRIIFRLRTGHCCLNAHMYRMGKTPSPMCSCLEDRQTPHHILQECPTLRDLRNQVWPVQTEIGRKLWGNLDDLRLTASFLNKTALYA